VVLAENLCGAWLVGSFAVGDADVHSDVDFIVATEDEVSDGQLEALQAMHVRLYEMQVPWAQHLEGSYIPTGRLREVDPARAEYLFLDNGSTELVRDNHCNTAVVRWTLREHGITLAGPDPKTLVDPVSDEQLHDEARRAMNDHAVWVRRDRTKPMSRWQQPYIVLTFCRGLHTLRFGVVGSKRVAGEWALTAVSPEWRSLVRNALDDRPDPWKRVHEDADPDDAARTLAFVDYAVAEAQTGSISR